MRGLHAPSFFLEAQYSRQSIRAVGRCAIARVTVAGIVCAEHEAEKHFLPIFFGEILIAAFLFLVSLIMFL
jgi:hypothetical protein